MKKYYNWADKFSAANVTHTLAILASLEETVLTLLLQCSRLIVSLYTVLQRDDNAQLSRYT